MQANPARHPAPHAGADAHPVASPCSLLRMAVGGERLSIPIDDVREILEVARLTPLPRTPDFVRGVMNLRGAVVPVVDLAARLALGRTTVGRRSCIVVVDTAVDSPADDDGPASAERMVVGLLVDAVYEVFDTDGACIEPVPLLGTVIRADFLRGIARAREQAIGVLALDRVLAPADLADAIAAFQPH